MLVLMDAEKWAMFLGGAAIILVVIVAFYFSRSKGDPNPPSD